MKKLVWDSRYHRTGEGYERERSADLYHTSRWTRLSRAWRAAHPLCEECRRKGLLKEGEVVDHIIPYPVCEDFFDEGNLQTLCADCNHLKGQRDKELIQRYRATGDRGLNP